VKAIGLGRGFCVASSVRSSETTFQRSIWTFLKDEVCDRHGSCLSEAFSPVPQSTLWKIDDRKSPKVFNTWAVGSTPTIESLHRVSRHHGHLV